MELPIERLGLIAYSGCRLTTALHYKTGAWSSIHQWRALYNRESKPWKSLQKFISLHLNGCSNLVMLSKTSLIKYVMTKKWLHLLYMWPFDRTVMVWCYVLSQWKPQVEHLLPNIIFSQELWCVNFHLSSLQMYSWEILDDIFQKIHAELQQSIHKKIFKWFEYP